MLTRTYTRPRENSAARVSMELACLSTPHGGTLVDLVVDFDRQEQLKVDSRTWASWDLTPRQLCDLELLLNGGFSPLRGFMGRDDYESVCSTVRLKNGVLWPIPVTLDVTEEFARKLKLGSMLALRDPEGVMLAALRMEDIWRPDRLAEAESVFGTTSKNHRGVAQLLDGKNPWYVGGVLEGMRLPARYDFRPLRLTPAQLRAEFVRLRWQKIVAFHTSSPMHRAQFELTVRAAKHVDAGLLIHPSVGIPKVGVVDDYTRVRCYRTLLPRYRNDKVKLALLPLAARQCGPREAVWHAIIRKNYGCTHFIVGPDHADPSGDEGQSRFYAPYEAQELLQKHQQELGIEAVPFKKLVYLENRDSYEMENQIAADSKVAGFSNAELRGWLRAGREIPGWFTFPEVAAELRRSTKPNSAQGLTIFLTGLSGAGKSTIANILLVRLLEIGGRPVTLLDGDIVRKHLSSELGFSKQHREINIRRIGFVASEITKNGGIAICAPIAPYDNARKEARSMVEAVGGFVLVHVATPLEICEQRDRKGLYAKARAGLLPQFTGISDPYEPPADAEVVIDTTVVTAEEAVEKILAHLAREGFLPAEPTQSAMQAGVSAR